MLTNYGSNSCLMRSLQTINDTMYANGHVVNAKEMIVPHLSSPYTDFEFPEAEPPLMSLNILHPLIHLIKVY